MFFTKSLTEAICWPKPFFLNEILDRVLNGALLSHRAHKANEVLDRTDITAKCSPIVNSVIRCAVQNIWCHSETTLPNQKLKSKTKPNRKTIQTKQLTFFHRSIATQTAYISLGCFIQEQSFDFLVVTKYIIFFINGWEKITGWENKKKIITQNFLKWKNLKNWGCGSPVRAYY